MNRTISTWRRAAIGSLAAGLTASLYGAGFNAQSYVQDGLIAQFDAIDNVGTGTHDASATVWKDLKGSASITLPSGVKWIDRALDAARVAMTAKGMPAFELASVSSEIAMDNRGHNPKEGYPRAFLHPGSDGWYSIYFSPGHDTPQLFIGQLSEPRPAFGTFKKGTLGIASDTTNFRTYNNGTYMGSSGTVVVTNKVAAATDWTFNVQYGYLEASYRAFRHYTRALTDQELKHNAWIDRVRFYSFQLSGESSSWATAQWGAPSGQSETAPTANTNDIVRVIGTRLSVEPTDCVRLKGISLEDGAVLVLPAGVDACTCALFVEGKTLPRGVYTGPEGTVGTKVDWISGAGLLRTAGENASRFPYITDGFGAHSYVQDGLVTQFDAIENVASGQAHDATAAKWLDLAGTASLTLTTNVTWREGRYFEKGGDGKPVYYGPMPVYKRDTITCDVPINIHESSSMDGVGGYPRIFAHGESFSIYFCGSATTAYVYLSGQKPDTRPEIGTFRIGTAAAFSGPNYYGGAKDGVVTHGKNTTTVPVLLDLRRGSDNWGLGNAGKMLATYGGLRFYNRCLTVAELQHNTLVDKFRYFSYRYVNTNDEAIAWAEIPWSVPEGQTSAAPDALTNQYVTIVGGTTTIAATDEIALLGLSLENGAKLKVADGATLSVKLLYVKGKAIDHCIYTGEGGTVGDVADWIEGKGQVRVAGATNRPIPYIALPGDGDGWWTFGYANGSANGQRQIVGEHVTITDAHWFPKGAKLRLKDYVLLDTVPDVFADYDTSGLKTVYVNGTRAFVAERPFEVPAGAAFRFLPGTWTAKSTYTYEVNSGANETLMAQTTGDVTLAAGANFMVSGDGLPNLTYSGLLSGDGNLYFNSYGRQMRFTGGFAVNGSSAGSIQNGAGFWVDTLAVTSSLKTVTLSGCGDKHGITATYSASYVMFGKNGSDATADHPLNIATLNGNANSRVDANGVRWRSGGHALVWGSNTIHVGTLNKGLHVVASRYDQNCNNGYLGRSYQAKGIGFVEIENFASGTIFGSTNVALTVGTVASGTTFDYTYQANHVNRLSLDITGTCSENATVMATDLAMLPARVSGFKGQVKLTETAAKTYEMPIDLSAGPQGLYNPVGCDGSGTLVTAPETSTINVTFPTEGVEPVKGKYAIARFSAGGELLDGWSVTLNGEAVKETRIGTHLIALRRTAKGLYLGVDQPGMRVILK